MFFSSGYREGTRKRVIFLKQIRESKSDFPASLILTNANVPYFGGKVF